MGKKEEADFIKEWYLPVFNRLFYGYSLLLFRRRFQAVWVDSTGLQRSGVSTLFIGNHNSWWDGLIPLLLNEKLIHLRGRAMMDEEQLKKHPFFRLIGTFSINRSAPRKAMQSLEYAAGMLNNAPAGKGIGLGVYPEGKITSPESAITLESGLVWLTRRLNMNKVDVIPFATHMHAMRSDKPELFIKFGNPVTPSTYLSGSMLMRTTGIMEDLRKLCRKQCTHFNPENGNPRGEFRLILGNRPKP